MSLEQEIQEMGARARAASRELAVASREQKDVMLRGIAGELRSQAAQIATENARDLSAAREKSLSTSLLKRLELDERAVFALADAVEEIAKLDDPVGEVMEKFQGAQDIQIERVRVPIGTIAMIYESRPNVTIDAAVLCLKTGNATILRGGSEAIFTNLALAEAMRVGGMRAGMPEYAVQLVPFTDRESVVHLARMDRYLDLLIPRGGKSLIETVVREARVPVIKHYDGICHLWIDAKADAAMAIELARNGKVARPSACNALETILVHRDIAESILPELVRALSQDGVECRGCEISREFAPCTPATEADWSTEYLDLIVSIRVVDSLDAAIVHINEFGSHHSDAIVTDDAGNAEKFLRGVDSACVYHNASTRFSDGGQFGFGAEIGISTDKLHARGPMGLRELTSYQYRIRGAGQIRSN